MRRYGLFWTGVGWFFRKLDEWFELQVWVVQTRPLITGFEMPQELADRFTFRGLNQDDLVAVCGIPGFDLTEDFVRQAFARGDTCDGVYDGEELIAFTWRTTELAPVIDDLWLRFTGEGMRYGYKALVLPAYRGMRLSHANARHHDLRYRSEGIFTDISYIALANLASLKNAYRDPRRKIVGFAGFLRRGDRFHTFRTPAVKKHLAFELHDDLSR